jgi:hypothetical protein
MDKPLHYEIHVTVKTEDVKGFIEECGAIGVKPIVLDLQTQSGDSIQDVMTSSKVTGTDLDAVSGMRLVSDHLSFKGFNVVREKIETVPWHPKALVHDENSGTGYFETHIPVLVREDNVKGFARLARFFSLHPSRNPFKKASNGYVVQMATLRKYNCSIDQFKRELDWAFDCIFKYGYSLYKEPEIEYALLDSNVTHDSDWIHS